MTETQTAVGELEFRSSQLADVNYPKRLIELIVMPYESETSVAYRGRAITEICSRGAYAGVEQRTSQIKVNRGHLIDMAVGKTVALHPSRHEGLVAEIRISRTELGEETLILADDGILEASAGFELLRQDGGRGPVYPDAEVWETRSRRRLNKLRLDHIAMTPDPAYPGARVLSVRSDRQPTEPAQPATPNRDRLEIERLRAELAALDARWGVR
jgi:phage head maturation protease